LLCKGPAHLQLSFSLVAIQDFLDFVQEALDGRNEIACPNKGIPGQRSNLNWTCMLSPRLRIRLGATFLGRKSFSLQDVEGSSKVPTHL
jgi:hypothetical protein